MNYEKGLLNDFLIIDNKPDTFEGVQMRLADKLIKLRKEKNWTQAIAAKNIAIQQSYLSKLENGRYIPSMEVIEKLSDAYGISSADLIELPRKRVTNIKYVSLGLFFGMLTITVGYFGLIYPQTYYTYKTSPIEQQNSSQGSLNYHLSDEYNGEKYIKEFSSVKYEYELIAQRDILRKENRWLISMGLLFLICSTGYFVVTLLINLSLVNH